MQECVCCCPSSTNEYFTMHYDFIGVIEQMECKSVCCCPSSTNENFTMHNDFIGVIEQMECKSVCAAVLP